MHAVSHEGGGLVAIDVPCSIGIGLGEQNRLGRDGNSRTCACACLGSRDAVRRGTVCQPKRAELVLEGRLISKALMIFRSALPFGVLHCFKLRLHVYTLGLGASRVAWKKYEGGGMSALRMRDFVFGKSTKFPGLVF